jgi:hypothetical protein
MGGSFPAIAFSQQEAGRELLHNIEGLAEQFLNPRELQAKAAISAISGCLAFEYSHQTSGAPFTSATLAVSNSNSLF